MQRLCRITVPGLSVKRDFATARRRLLAAFPNVEEVIATTAPGTLLVLSSGSVDVEAWLEVLLDSRAPEKVPAARRLLHRLAGSRGDSAA